MCNYKTLPIRVMKFLLARHFSRKQPHFWKQLWTAYLPSNSKKDKQNIVPCMVYKVICRQDILYCSAILQTEKGERANTNE